MPAKRAFDEPETSGLALAGVLMPNVRTVVERACADVMCWPESPIERLLLFAMAKRFCTWWGGVTIAFGDARRTFGFREDATIIRVQEQIEQYRADFLIEYTDRHCDYEDAGVEEWDEDAQMMLPKLRRINESVDTYKLVVECDGHEFHERTKDQAKRDRSRDRTMMLGGLDVFRFTGSEIWADPCACAGQVLDYFWRKSRKGQTSGLGDMAIEKIEWTH